MFPLLFIDEEKKKLRSMFDELDQVRRPGLASNLSLAGVFSLVSHRLLAFSRPLLTKLPAITQTHDGKVSAKELKDGLRKVGLGLSDGAIEELLAVRLATFSPV